MVVRTNAQWWGSLPIYCMQLAIMATIVTIGPIVPNDAGKMELGDILSILQGPTWKGHRAWKGRTHCQAIAKNTMGLNGKISLG